VHADAKVYYRAKFLKYLHALFPGGRTDVAILVWRPHDTADLDSSKDAIA
jgi:hypothetical protein